MSVPVAHPGFGKGRRTQPGPKLGNAWPPRKKGLHALRRPIFPQTSGEDQKKKKNE